MCNLKLIFNKSNRPDQGNKLASNIIDNFYLKKLSINDCVFIERDYHPLLKLDNISSTLNNYLLKHKLKSLFTIEITYNENNLSSARKLVKLTKIK